MVQIVTEDAKEICGLVWSIGRCFLYRKGGTLVQETVSRCRDIAAERASLEAEIEGRTLCGALAETATRLAGRDALRWGTHGEGMSWGEFYESVGHFALGLEAFPFPRGSFVVLLTQQPTRAPDRPPRQ